MPDLDTLDERLRAIERALTDDDRDLTDLRDAAELTREVESLRERLDRAEDRLDELDAATQALRGYVGSVRAVNETVERRADAALAKAEALEANRAGDSKNRPPKAEGTCECERWPPDRRNLSLESHSRPASATQKSSETNRTGAFARVGRLLGLR